MKKKKIDLKLKSYTISKFETGNIKGGTRIGCNEPIDLSLLESCPGAGKTCGTLSQFTCTLNNCGTDGGGTDGGGNNGLTTGKKCLSVGQC